MLTFTQMHETFPIALAHKRTRNTSENLLANYTIQVINGIYFFIWRSFKD